jgi:uncharacterized lipoprotein YehR (DUF1307 family)
MKKTTFFSSILIVLLASCGDVEPHIQFAFINTSDRTTNYTVMSSKNDSLLSYDEIKPKAMGFFSAPKENCNVLCKFLKTKDSNFFQEKIDTTSAKDNYFCVDATGKGTFVLVNASYLYEANTSFAESLKNSSGKKKILQGIYYGDKVFKVPFDTHMPYDGLPKEIHAMSDVIVLVPLPKSVKMEDEVYKAIDELV